MEIKYGIRDVHGCQVDEGKTVSGILICQLGYCPRLLDQTGINLGAVVKEFGGIIKIPNQLTSS